LEQHYHTLVRGDRRGLWPSLQRGALWTLSVPYHWAVGVRNGMYDRGWKQSFRAPVPVISVGNLTLGGTGKTPCVEYLARWFRDQGRRVAILSRGHGRHDEALVLGQYLPDIPHLQGADRVALARTATEELNCDLLVLDDGFQHRRLARDLDLVLIDATVPWGHGYLFPRGLLREPPFSLRRANLIVLTRCDQATPLERERLRRQIAQLAPDVPVVETRHRPHALVSADGAEQSLEVLRRGPVAAFCGIGNPQAFRRTLRGLGASVGAFQAFPDHYAYSPADVENLDLWAGRLPTGGLVVTTEKDLVKIRARRLAGQELWAIRIQLHLDQGQDVLDRKLHQVLSRKAA
jgi:tetraacyldisaccharide 4'-kinase